ncbi:MAG: YajQ family cyclic di-GMP-binding protein [Myxococcales bacterium]|nr:YajQ family cyclic di-GMP-binding protein [Myxococcales bacterium]
MPAFDVVSRVDLQELDNAFNQAKKEIGQRYDFRGSDTDLERTEKTVHVRSSNEMQLRTAIDIFQQKMAKRGLPLKNLEQGEIEKTSKGAVKVDLTLKEGIEKEVGKRIVKDMKALNSKVQGQVMDDQVRFTGKNRDDLQAVIAALRNGDYGVELQFVNFRD